MNSFIDKLNLRPAERRLLVGVGVVLFIILNMWLIWPHFKDWKKLRGEIAVAESTLATFKAEIAKLPGYQTLEKKLKGDGGAALATAEMALALMKVVQPKASVAGIQVVSWDPRKGRSERGSEYFEEQTLRISFKATSDDQLLKFLVSLGEGDSTIRIRDLNIRPEPTRFKLMGDVTMIASYQRAEPVAKR